MATQRSAKHPDRTLAEPNPQVEAFKEMLKRRDGKRVLLFEEWIDRDFRWRRMLRTVQACTYLGISAAQLRAMVMRGELKAIVEPGAPWRFDVRDLNDWIERSKTLL